MPKSQSRSCSEGLHCGAITTADCKGSAAGVSSIAGLEEKLFLTALLLRGDALG